MPENFSELAKLRKLPEPMRLEHIATLAREAEKPVVDAVELLTAARLAVRGVDDSDVTVGIGRLLEIISDHVNAADIFRCKVLNIAKGGDDA